MADKYTYVTWAVRAVVVVAIGIIAFKIVPPMMQAQKAQPVWNEAVEAFNNQDYDKAIRLYEDAKMLAPDFKQLQDDYPKHAAMAWAGKGQKLEADGQTRQAAEAYAKAVELDPAEAARLGAACSAAECFNRLEEYEKALKYAEIEVQHNGANKGLAENLAKLLKKKINRKSN